MRAPGRTRRNRARHTSAVASLGLAGGLAFAPHAWPASASTSAPTTTTTTTRASATTSTTSAAPLVLGCRAPTTSPTTTSPTTTSPTTTSPTTTSPTTTSPTTTSPTRAGVPGTSGTSGASGTSGRATTTTTTTTTLPPRGTNGAYYLIESNGTVFGFGGAPVYGSAPQRAMARTSVVAAAEKPGGGGYWLLTAAGNVFNFGSAVDWGTPVHLHHSGTWVGIAATPDGSGFLVVTTTGSVQHYGNAPFCGSPVHETPRGHIGGIVDSPDGNGYWVWSTGGDVYAYGDVRAFGGGPGPHGSPIVGMAATPDGRGYWLAYADGSVRQFGDAPFHGSAVHIRLTAPIAGFGATPDGGGYYLVGQTGRFYQFGDAHFSGSLAKTPPKPPVRVAVLLVAALPPAPPPTTTTTPPSPPTTTLPPPVPPLTGDPYLHGSFGADISDFQCAKPGSTSAMAKLPASTGFAVVQVVGWLDSSVNSCLAAEVAWALAAAPENPVSLYIFMNSPGKNASAATQSATGPAGTCATLAASAQAPCRAYNYGYNGAANAYADASAQGVASPLWWLDIENASLAAGQYSNFSAGQYWSSSTTLNDRTIQGAIDALRSQGATVGIYSTSLQYPKIAGTYVPSGPQLPLWIAGTPWTSPPYTESGLPSPTVLASWCAGSAHYSGDKGNDLFAGGVPWLLQETPGNLPSPYGIDPDYAC